MIVLSSFINYTMGKLRLKKEEIKMNRINLIALGVQNMEKALAFYKGIGFKCYENSSNPPIVFFDNQGTKLELFPLKELAQDINAQTPPTITQQGFNGITFAINTKEKREVDELMALVKEKGGTVAKIPETVSWGGYSGYFQDPDGYYWEVAYADSWKFDEHNMLVIEP